MTSEDKLQRRRMSMPSVAMLSFFHSNGRNQPVFTLPHTDHTEPDVTSQKLHEKRKRMFRRSVSSSFESPVDDDVMKTSDVTSANGSAKKKKARPVSFRRVLKKNGVVADGTPIKTPAAQQPITAESGETSKRGRRGSLPASIMSATLEASLRRFRFKKSQSTDRMTSSSPKNRRGRLFSVSVRLPSGCVTQVSFTRDVIKFYEVPYIISRSLSLNFAFVFGHVFRLHVFFSHVAKISLRLQLMIDVLITLGTLPFPKDRHLKVLGSLFQIPLPDFLLFTCQSALVFVTGQGVGQEFFRTFFL